MLWARRIPANLIKLSVACWLFNPFTITISTRGSGEALVAVQILLMLRCLTHGMHSNNAKSAGIDSPLLMLTFVFTICQTHATGTPSGACSDETLSHMCTGQTKAAAMLLGVAVHWRVYPIMYSLPIMLWLPSATISKASKHQVCLMHLLYTTYKYALLALPTQRNS